MPIREEAGVMVRRRRLFCGLTLAIALATAPLLAASAYDGFDAAGIQLSTSIWTTEFGAPSFLGRTQLRDWVNGSNVGPFTVAGGSAELALETFNPTGLSFYGTHAKTLTSFKPTAATDYVLTARMRLTTIQPGLVFGIYFFGCDAGPCATHHDELDIELVTNFLQPGGAPLRVQLNRYAAEPLGVGHGPIVNLPAGFDPLAFHEWKIRWSQSRVAYYLDDEELFTTTTFVPQGAMQANIIAWAPAAEWPDAFDASLQFTADSQQNQRFTALVDYVSVSPIAAASGPARSLTDLNGDGVADLLLQHSASANVAAWLMNGAGQPSSAISIYAGDVGGWRVGAAADLNRDGIDDVVIQHPVTKFVGALMLDGAGVPTSFRFVYPADIGGWTVVGAADLNGDSIDDVILQHASTTFVGAWLMDGKGNAASFAFVYAGAVADWHVVAVADLNVDGIADIVLQNSATTFIGVWLMNGAGQPASFQYVYPGQLEDWRVVGAADVNHDGIDDLVLQRTSTTWVAAFQMNGAAQVSSFVYVYPGGVGGWRVNGRTGS
jgi:hypothetical protein